MPMQSFLRSETTGELITDETLEMAALDHNIDIAETSVGSLFNLHGKKKKASYKTASRKVVKLSYKDRRRKRAGLEKSAAFSVGDMITLTRENNAPGVVTDVTEDRVHIRLDTGEIGDFSTAEAPSIIKKASFKKTADSYRS